MSNSSASGDYHESSHRSHHKSRRNHDRHHRSSREKMSKTSSHSGSHQERDKFKKDKDSERLKDLSDREYEKGETHGRYKDEEKRREKERYRESSRDKDRSSGKSRDRHRRSSREYEDGYSEGDDRSRYHSSYSKSRNDYLKKKLHHSPSYYDKNKEREYYNSITPLHLKKRKLNNWDMPPAEYPGVSARQLKASGIFPARGTCAVEDYSHNTDYGAYQNLSRVSGGSYNPNHSRTSSPRRSSREAGRMSPSNSIDTTSNSHTGTGSGVNVGSNQVINLSRQARRLYVGNLPYDIVEDALVDFLNDTMVQWNLTKRDSNPAIFAQINHDKSFAFVEFRTPEDATAAMAFDGLTFSGQSLKIRRPKDYQPPPGSYAQSPSVCVPGVVSTNVPDSSDKIFVGGLPLFLNDEQVMELLKSFGELKAFNLVRDSIHGTSKGFAFCEYADPSVTDAACQELNGMEIGDRHIVVQRASVGATTRLGPSSLTPGFPLSNFPPTSAPTVISNSLILLNMLTFDDIIDEKEYSDIIDDIREECQKFGEIVTISIPRTPDTLCNTDLAKVYVEFTTQESCSKALNSLAGRKFLDRTIITTYCNHPIPSS